MRDPYWILRRAWDCRGRAWIFPTDDGIIPGTVIIHNRFMHVFPVAKVICLHTTTPLYLEYNDIIHCIRIRCLKPTCPYHYCSVGDESLVIREEEIPDVTKPNKVRQFDQALNRYQFPDVIAAMRREGILPEDLVIKGTIWREGYDPQDDMHRVTLYNMLHFTITSNPNKCKECGGDYEFTFKPNCMTLFRKCSGSPHFIFMW